MATEYQVRVSDKWRFPTFRSAGREFTKAQAILIHGSDRGSAEILRCPFLEAVEIDEPEAEQPELDEIEDQAEPEAEQPELDEIEDQAEPEAEQPELDEIEDQAEPEAEQPELDEMEDEVEAEE